MFLASKFVEFVLKMVGMPYWYGTCVYICSASLLNSKSKHYPDHYGASRMEKYRNAIQAKLVCADCVGLIKGFFWTNGGQGVVEYINGGEKYTNKYASNGCPDKSASGMLSWCKAKGCKNGKIATLPEVPGVLLFSSGHVGVYVGNGYAVEARGFNYGIVKTKVKDRSWTDWAYLPESLLQYDTVGGVTIPEPEPVVVTPTVYKLGDRTLKLTSPYMTGDDVKELQTALNALGYNCGSVDGVFGKKTESGLRAFQTACKITVDGIFGKQSKTALDALLDAPAPPVEEQPAPVEPEPVDTTVSVYPIHGFIPDISAYQVAIDMDKFVAGNDFAILRARVNGKTDSKFVGWAKELKARNFPFAVYDYLRLKSKEDAIEQADKMFSTCYPYRPRIYYLDTEQLADGVTYVQEKEFIKVYVQRLREWGVECIGQYTGDYRWRTQYKDLNDIFDTLWIASWGKNTGSPDGITLKSATLTDKIALHQYTSYGYTKVAGAPGINHRIDLNRLTGVKPLSWFTGRTYENEPAPVPDLGYTKYVVQAKDTLWGIAKKLLGNGNKYKTIMTANGMTSTVIHKGDVLNIPTA